MFRAVFWVVLPCKMMKSQLYYFGVCDISDECEISSSHGGKYEVQICLLGCTAV
jgi:hypothetical protein